MPKQPGYEPEPGPEYADEHHQRISEFANDYFDDDEEREAFVDTLMERRGYQKRHVWGPPDPSAQPDPDPEPEPQRQPARGGQSRKSPYFKNR